MTRLALGFALGVAAGVAASRAWRGRDALLAAVEDFAARCLMVHEENFIRDSASADSVIEEMRRGLIYDPRWYGGRCEDLED